MHWFLENLALFQTSNFTACPDRISQEESAQILCSVKRKIYLLEHQLCLYDLLPDKHGYEPFVALKPIYSGGFAGQLGFETQKQTSQSSYSSS